MKLYLRDFTFWDPIAEEYFLANVSATDLYPFRVLSKRGMRRMDFAPITILYGGNGPGSQP